jgi:hypothetical protein
MSGVIADLAESRTKRARKRAAFMKMAGMPAMPATTESENAPLNPNAKIRPRAVLAHVREVHWLNRILPHVGLICLQIGSLQSRGLGRAFLLGQRPPTGVGDRQPLHPD